MTFEEVIRWIKRFYWDRSDLLNKAVSVNLKSGAKVNDGTIWHSGNDGSGSGLDADLLDGIDSAVIPRRRNYTFTPTAGQWYRIARTNGGGGRGPGRIMLVCAGGSVNPRVSIIDIFGTWSSGADVRVFVHGNQSGTGWTQYRITYDGSTYRYLEAYFATSNSYSVYDMYLLHGWDSWVAIQPEAGGGTVELAAWNDVTTSFHNITSFNVNGLDMLPVAWSTPSLNTGWANYGGSTQTAKYMRNGRLLTLTGVVKATSGTPSAAIFTLPSGYRPSADIYYSAMSFLAAGSPQYVGRGIQISSAGNVSPSNWSPVTNDWVSLDITIGL